MANKNISISGIAVGEGNPAFIIAEAGVNHNGSVRLAKKLVVAAKEAGADCVKFQTFKADRVVTLSAPKAAYQLQTTPKGESQFEMLKNLELSHHTYKQLLDLCAKLDIIFLSTPYSSEDVDFLDDLGVKAFKIASGQIVELQFLRYVALKRKPILLSTGMATLREVEQAVQTIRKAGNKEIVLLQCTTNYPSKIEEANLRTIKTMREKFGLNIGYSDHTDSVVPVIAAVALHASVIEKHFTLDKNMPGPDHSSSAEPAELAAMVEAIRKTEKALGSPVKKPSASEAKNKQGMRRSVTARLPITTGDSITPEMLCFKRPATGLSPIFADKLIGKKARRDIPQDSFITFKDILL